MSLLPELKNTGKNINKTSAVKTVKEDFAFEEQYKVIASNPNIVK